jgi:hypothetical protein
MNSNDANFDSSTTGSIVSEYGNQFVRFFGGIMVGTIEFNTPANSAPANAQLFFEVGIQANMKGIEGDGENITLIYKENHGAPGNKNGKYNVKAFLSYKIAKNGQSASYINDVKLGVEDNHDEDTSPVELKGVKYENEDILSKYEPGGGPIKARGSYQDTKDGGVRYKLEILNPDTKEWKRIFDHVDYGDENHNIKNYRGKSAFRSTLRIDGHSADFVRDINHAKEILHPLQSAPISTQKTEEQKRLLTMLGYGNITFKEMDPDQSDLVDGINDPLSLGLKN